MTGILILNKPAGITSFGAISQAKSSLGVSKIGHAGTLDPMATGILPLLLGDATKLSNWIMADTKEYIATIQLGLLTDTWDTDGKPIETMAVPPLTAEDIEKTLAAFVGTIRQTPPIFSAIKINGKPSYAYARNGETPVLSDRTITIHGIELLKWEQPFITIRVQCGKGTYIRSLAHDIGQKIGTLGTLSALCRSRVGPFDLSNASTLNDICLNRFTIIRMSDALSHLPSIVITLTERIHFITGNAVQVLKILANHPMNGRLSTETDVRIVTGDNALVAIIRCDGIRVHFRSVFINPN